MRCCSLPRRCDHPSHSPAAGLERACSLAFPPSRPSISAKKKYGCGCLCVSRLRKGRRSVAVVANGRYRKLTTLLDKNAFAVLLPLASHSVRKLLLCELYNHNPASWRRNVCLNRSTPGKSTVLPPGS